MAAMPSTAIAAAHYDANKATLRIRYVTGGTYDYLGVPPDLFAAFEDAGSKGRFVNLVIKPHFPFKRVTGRA